MLLREDGTDPVVTATTTAGSSQPTPTSKAPTATRSPTPTDTAPASPTATPTDTSTPTPTPTPTATPTGDLAGDVAAASSAFSDQVGALERAGVLDKDVAKTLDEGVRDVDKALREGEQENVSEEADALVQDYDEGVQDGSIPSEATAELDPLLADLTDAVDAYVAG